MAANEHKLVMRSEPSPGKNFYLDKDEIYIGRDVNNNIVINDAEVSRRHARISRQDDKYIMEDLGSTNGTFINRARLSEQHILQPGDKITLGENVNLTFEMVQPEPPAAEPDIPHPKSEPQPPLSAYPSERLTQPETPLYPPHYASQVPPSPVEPSPVPKGNGRTNSRMILGCIGFTVLLCILVVIAIVIIDQLDIWCNVLPFLPGCQV